MIAKINKNTKYLIPLTLSLILVLVEMIILRIAPFGSKDLFTYSGGEGVVSYLYELWDNAHSGRILFFSTRSGVGYDFATIISMYLFNPLFSIYLLLPRESVLVFSGIIYLLEISISGLSLFVFLKNHTALYYSEGKIKDIFYYIAVAVYVSSILVFHSGINPINALSIALLPLVFWGLDRLVAGGKSIIYILALALIICNSLKIALPVLALSLLYISVISLFRFDNILRILPRKLLYDLIVLGLSLPVILGDIKCSGLAQEIDLDMQHVFKYTEGYLILLPVFSFIIFLIYFMLIQKIRETSIPKLPGLLSVLYILSAVIYVGSTGLMNYNNAHSFSEYEFTTTARIDKAIDTIRREEPDARIYVYDKNGKTTSPVINAVLGYNYVITPDENVIPDCNLELDRHYTGLDIYRVPALTDDIESMSGVVVPSSLTDISLKSEYPYQKMNDLSYELTGVADIFVEADDNLRVEHDDDDPTAYDKNKITYSFDESGDYYTNLADVIHMGNLKKDEKYSTKTHYSNRALRSYLTKRESVYLDNDKLEAFIEALAGSNVAVSLSDNMLTIDSKASQNSILLPYDLGDSFVATDGSSGFNDYRFFDNRVSTISSSDAVSTYNYKPLFLIRGLWFMVAALIALVAVFYLDKKDIRIKLPKWGKIVEAISRNRIYIYAILVNLLVYIVALIITESHPFGDKSFVCSDGMIISFPQLRGWVESIKSGRFTVPDYSLGTGWSGVSYISVFMAFVNPVKWILFLMNGSNSETVFNIYFLVNYLLISPSIIFYLTNRVSGDRLDKQELKLLPISMAYSLSSFVIVYFSFLEFIEFAYIIPLMILAMERVVFKRKYNFYIILLAIYMSTSTYYAFILCECLLLYFCTLRFDGFRDFINKGVRFALSSIMAAGLAVFTLIPFYLKTRSSGYIAEDSGALGTIHYFSQNLLGSISDVDIMYNSTIISSDWSHANAYCGLLVFLIAPLILIIKKIPLNVRIRRLGLAALLYFSFGNELMNYVLHGFHFQTLVPNRFACFYIFVLVVIFYDLVIEYRSIFDSRGLAAFSICSGLLLFVLMYNTGFNAVRCLKSALLVLAYLCIALVGFKYRKHYQCMKCMLIILMLELSVSGYHALKVYDGSYMVSENAIRIMKEYNMVYNPENNPFIRAEVLNYENYNDAAIVKNNSVSMLDSIITEEQRNYISSYGGEMYPNNIEYGVGNPMADIMFNVNYQISEGGTQPSIPKYYVLDKEDECVKLYRNIYAATPGLILPKDYDISKYRKDKSSIQCQNTISNQLINKNLYSIIDTDIKTVKEEDDSYTVSFNIPNDINDDIFFGGDDVIFFQSEAENAKQHSYEVGLIKEYYEGHFNHMNVATVDLSAYEELSEYFKAHSADRCLYDWDKNEIVCNYNALEDGKLLIPVPAYKNWTASIDGKPVTVDDSAGGLTIPVPAGKHTVIVRYIPDSNLPYFIISFVFLVVLVSINIVKKSKSK